MKLPKLYLIIVIFILFVFSVNAEDLNVKDGAEVNGVYIKGNGFVVDATGNFVSNGGSGKISNFDISGDISSGKIVNEKLSGTAGTNGATVAGVYISKGVNFELDLATGKITTPNGGAASFNDQKINLDKNSGIIVNSDGSYSVTGYSKITDAEGDKAEGTDISYSSKDKVFSSKKDLMVVTNDGKVATGKNIAVSVQRMNLQQATNFLSSNPNSAALNVIGADTKQRGLISVSVTKNSLTTTTAGLKPETIITRQGKNIFYEYTGNEKNFARTDIEFMIGNNKGTMVTLQQKEGSSYTSKIAAASLNMAAKPHPDAQFTVNDFNLLFKDKSGSTTSMLEIKSGDGPTLKAVTTDLNTPFPKPENVQIAKNGDINAKLMHSPMIMDISIRPNPASIENSLISDNPQENIGEFMRNGKFTLDMAFNLQNVHLQSFFGLTGTVGLAGSPLRSSLQDMFVVSGVEGRDLLKLEEGITTKVSGGGIFSQGSVISFNKETSTISFYSKPSDSQPYSVQVSPVTINRILNEKIGPITNYLASIPTVSNRFTKKK